MQFQDVLGGYLGVFGGCQVVFLVKRAHLQVFYDILVIQSGLIVNT